MHSETHAVGNGDNSSLQASQDEFESMVRNIDVKSRIMDQYADWKGVRYRLGGSTKKGIDCSSFVQRTFREQFGLELPRSTYEQQETGKSVSRTNLRTGDLVLFRAGSTGRHVGIYIGNNQFVHASTSSGVVISSMNEPYWKKRYNEARRVLSRS
jgi:lipoprotein Spr